jgi:acyl-CoA thioester hydrolase
MTSPPRRQKGGYFTLHPDAPPPLIVRLEHRIRFSDVDPMGILWHGRYAQLFEQANEEIGRQVKMSYTEFRAEKLTAPIVQFHVDFFSPLKLGEQAAIIGKLLWNEGARMDIEYEIHNPSGRLAAAGYTVQMFVDETATPLMASPALLETCRKRWRAGEFGAMR